MDKMRNRKSVWITGVIVAAGLFVLGTFFLAGCAGKAEKQLETVKVTRGSILAELPTTGIVVPRNRLEIKPPVAGRIEQVMVVEGQRVTKGQVLAWMSSNERAALLDSARSQSAEEIKYWEEVYKPAPITSALNGFIIKRSMEPGQTFSVSDVVLVMADKLIVKAQIDETDIGRIKVGQKAEIVLDAYPGNSIPAVVEQIAYESETINNVVVYQVNVLPKEVPSYFRSGMSATVNFVMDQRKDVLTLPNRVIKKKGGNSYVFIKSTGGAKTLQIQTGLENSVNVEIISGINEGDEVVVPTSELVKKYFDRQMRTPINIFGKKKTSS
jgi:macrolide-specific efflux system membrane fusion protein